MSVRKRSIERISTQGYSIYRNSNFAGLKLPSPFRRATYVKGDTWDINYNDFNSFTITTGALLLLLQYIEVDKVHIQTLETKAGKYYFKNNLDGTFSIWNEAEPEKVTVHVDISRAYQHWNSIEDLYL